MRLYGTIPDVSLEAQEARLKTRFLITCVTALLTACSSTGPLSTARSAATCPGTAPCSQTFPEAISSAAGHKGLSPSQITPRWWHWVVPGQLIASPAPEKTPGGVKNWLAELQEAAHGDSLAVLNLRHKDYPVVAGEVASYLHLPIADFSPPSKDDADRALAFIDENMRQDRVVVVHSHGGCGRTGTILAAWLKRTGSVTGDEAIARLRRLKQCFVETEEQKVFIDNYPMTESNPQDASGLQQQ